MIKWMKKMWLKIRLRFAKRHIGIDYGNGKDLIAWCECKVVDGIMYITKQGFGKPPAKVLKGGQIYI